MNPEIGIVSIHAHIILSTTVHRMALKRLAAPTPMIDAVMLCVVETGMPKWEATPMIAAEVVSAANP
jgi:hypothetical protein